MHDKGFAASALAAIALLCLSACASEPLEPWHNERLEEEFTADMVGDGVENFEDYLEVENRVFVELREKVYVDVETGPEFALVRYSAGSAADPKRRSTDFNRTFEWPVEDARGGVLLLHGMSDSPYSLHSLGERLHEEGYWVIGLRLPGHGTAPSGMKYLHWRDMAAAVQIAMEHLRAQLDGAPLHMIGYSTGAPLALNYSLDAINNDSLAEPASLILVSPAIGISAAAALARPSAAVGRVPGLRRLGWTAVTPEFDPFKYNSFATNAGSQVHQLTRTVANRISSLGDDAAEFPPILVFKSTVDATVTNTAVVDRLLRLLPENGNELVLFDVNRYAVRTTIIIDDPGPMTDAVMADASLPFSVSLVTNREAVTQDVVLRHKPPFSADISGEEGLDLAWPAGVISLSHVALPFSPQDPLYGTQAPDDPNQLFLGQAEIRGERGLLRISSDWLLRIRYNPFYSVLEDRSVEWIRAN